MRAKHSHESVDLRHGCGCAICRAHFGEGLSAAECWRRQLPRRTTGRHYTTRPGLAYHLRIVRERIGLGLCPTCSQPVPQRRRKARP